ncbi:MAG: LytR C-terminal domain-containing protein [Actinomycetota bacterium]
MKRSWLTLAATVLVGLLAGVALAGRPHGADQTVIPASTPATSTTEPVVVASTTIAASTTTAGPDTTPAPNTTGAPDPAEVQVLAVNGTRREGIATRTADRLKAAGFTQSAPTDSLDPIEVTAVYYRDGFLPAATSVALALGLDPAGVVPYGQAISAADDGGDVIVAIGNDFEG